MDKTLGLKLFIIVLLGLLILVPVTMVQFKVYERQQSFEFAKQSVAQSWTGAQTFMTPVIVIPYSTLMVRPSLYAYQDKNRDSTDREKKYSQHQRNAFLVPERMQANIELENSNLNKGIYRVPVYNSSIELVGSFNSKALKKRLQEIQSRDDFSSLGQPYISFYIRDIRGLSSKPGFNLAGLSYELEAGSKMSSMSQGLSLSLVDKISLADLASKPKLDFALNFGLRGMEQLAFIPLSHDSKVSLVSNWPHPKFIGSSLPQQRNINSSGFEANWVANKYSNNADALLQQCLGQNHCAALKSAEVGVSFIEAVDVYLQTERAIKYAVLFIGLIFISFFIFEQLKSIAIHPVQYAFVGFAIAVFYLLLIALSEHLSFALAYACAAVACLILLCIYLQAILQSLRNAAYFIAVLALLYSCLFVIVQAEDFAFLMGAVLVFVVLAVLMLLTRKIDWYRIKPAS